MENLKRVSDYHTGTYILCSSNPSANGDIWYSIDSVSEFIDTQYPYMQFPNTKFWLLDLDSGKEITIR